MPMLLRPVLAWTMTLGAGINEHVGRGEGVEDPGGHEEFVGRFDVPHAVDEQHAVAQCV